VSLLTGEQPTPQWVIPRMHAAVNQALDEAGVPLARVAGIGIASPGPLDNRTGVIYSPPNLPEWESIPLRNLFANHFHVPTWVENDANAAAWGEYLFGAGRGCQNMVYLTVSTGIGGGMIIDGKIVEGTSGTAGELGHMTIDWRGKPCRCGNVGCLEFLSSGTAIARQAHEAIRAGQGNDLLTFAHTMHPHREPMKISRQEDGDQRDEHALSVEEQLPINAHTVALAAEAGIPVARTIITQAAQALGAGLVNIIHVFNPERIVLGGGVTQMGSLLVEPALQIVQERSMKRPREAVRVLLAELEPNAGLVGAGALMYRSNPP
jgi:glucokinase